MAGTAETLGVGIIPYEKIDEIVKKYKGDSSAIIPILQDIQELMDYVPKDSIAYMAEKLGVSPAKIYGIVTFYAQFRLQPMGKYMIMLCEGTACHVNGAKLISGAITDELGIRGGETTPDGLFTLEKVACIGCCSLSPVMVIGGETYAKLTPDATRKIIKEYQQKEEAAQN
ncbi:MAG: NADH-quinone oxidoreductase subunit NuoE [Bacillota bacterium]